MKPRNEIENRCSTTMEHYIGGVTHANRNVDM